MNTNAKRLLSLLLALVLVIGILPVSALAAETTEVGSQADLAAMSSGSYVLTQDITLDNWTTMDFSGTLNGNGHTITLTGTTLFGTMKGTVTNLILKGSVAQTANKNTGSLCQSCSGGTIRNCISDVTVTFSGTSIYAYVGQITGTFNSSATISNCLLLGSVEPGVTSLYGAAGASYNALNISNCVAVGYDQIAMKDDYPSPSVITSDSCTLVAADAYDPSAYLEAFNANRSADDLEWEIANGALTLKKVVADTAGQEQLDALSAAITAAEAVNTSVIYTGASWSSYQSALTAAKGKAAEAAPTASSVETATTALNNAVSGLSQRSAAAVAEPASGVVEITQSNYASYLENPVAGTYYKLTEDITISGTWFGAYSTMNAILDGDGHTITLGGSPLWTSIGEGGVIQNLGILGSAQFSSNDTGAIAQSCSGVIVNCWSKAAVSSAGQNNYIKNTGGFIANLKSGGAIVNCWNAGTVTASGSTGTGVKGALAGTAEANTLIANCYWQESGLSAVGSGSGLTSGNSVKSQSEFGTSDFVSLLNSNTGTYGKQWNMSASGYPWFGEAQDYTPDEPVEITFTSYKGVVTTFMSDEGLTISLGDLDKNDSYYAGELSMEGATGWSADGTLIYNTNKLYPDNEAASYKVTVYYGESDSRTFTVNVVAPQDAVALRLIAGETILTDGSALTVQGSERIVFSAEAQYEADGEWESVPTSLLTFAADDTGTAHVNGAVFYATAPGTMTVTATGLSQSVSVNITSQYVAVTSITPAASGTYTVHGRNANSDSSGEFLDLKLGHGVGNVIIAPENASYQGWTLESSNPDVAEYVDAFLKAVLPKKAGTTTLTATSNDPNATVSGTSEITIAYRNPVTAVNFTGENNAMTVTANQTVDLPLAFTGTAGMENYHVTEPGMVWSFQSSDGGEVSITRDSLGILLKTEEEYCVANDQYKITGESAGTVIVTGTPVDTTGGAQAVTFTVTVESGEEETAVDVDALVTEAMTGAQSYLNSKAPDSYVFGNEWEIFAQTRSGVTLDQTKIDAYLASVKDTYSAQALSETASVSTTIARVALTLGALGKDASNFEGIDLIEMLYNGMGSGLDSNAYIFALLAIDSGDYEVPADATWTRDALIHQILTFASASGGFGLSSNAEVGTDMTGMALQALAPYYSTNSSVKTAVDNSLTYLQGIMTRNGEFGSAEATAQVLVALTALNKNPVDEENGFVKSVARNIITGICTYRNSETGAFTYDGDDNKMATIQSLYALESYVRYRDSENALYDLTDVVVKLTPVEPAADAEITVTISNKGNVVMARKAVAVTDINEDGKLNVDEALYAAHASGFTGGASAGYGTYTGDWGLAINKLWGVETTAVGYWLNDASCWSLDDEVRAGDYLVAWVYQSSSWADAYSRLDSASYSATTGTAMTTSLQKSAYDSTAGGYIFSAISGATIIAYNSDLTAADVCSVTDNGDGTYAVTFSTAGEYYLVAAGNTETVLVPAVAKVTVSQGQTEPEGIPGDVDGDNDVTLDDAMLAYNISVGSVSATAAQEAAADMDGNNDITLDDAMLIYNASISNS